MPAGICEYNLISDLTLRPPKPSKRSCSFQFNIPMCDLLSFRFPSKVFISQINGNKPNIQTIGGPQLPISFPTHHSAKCKKFQSSSLLLKPRTCLVCLKPCRWHCYCLGNFWRSLTRLSRVHSGIGFGTDLSTRVFPVIGLKELTHSIPDLCTWGDFSLCSMDVYLNSCPGGLYSVSNLF
jgi:hypothetical protein